MTDQQKPKRKAPMPYGEGLAKIKAAIEAAAPRGLSKMEVGDATGLDSRYIYNALGRLVADQATHMAGRLRAHHTRYHHTLANAQADLNALHRAAQASAKVSFEGPPEAATTAPKPNKPKKTAPPKQQAPKAPKRPTKKRRKPEQINLELQPTPASVPAPVHAKVAALQGEPIITSDTKVTIAPTPKGRFEPDARPTWANKATPTSQRYPDGYSYSAYLDARK